MNVAQLAGIFHMAGQNVRIGSINPEIKNRRRCAAGRRTDHAGARDPQQSGRLGLKGFDPCTILLNNDLSAGVPGILEELHERYLLPPLHAGWSVRRKSAISSATKKWPSGSADAGHRPLADQS